MYVPTTGVAGALRCLEEMLAENHAEHSRRRREEIKARNESGIPLDDDTDFDAVSVWLSGALEAAGGCDTDGVRDALGKVAAALGGALKTLPPREPVEDYKSIFVRLRAMPHEGEGGYMDCVLALARAAASDDQDQILDAIRLFVKHGVAEVVGLEGDEGPIAVKATGKTLSEDHLDTLSAAGLLGGLMSCARRFQELTGDEKKRFGRRPPAPSRASGATAVPEKTASVEAATAAAGPYFEAPNTNRTLAPVGSTSTTLGSELSMSFTPLPTAAS